VPEVFRQLTEQFRFVPEKRRELPEKVGRVPEERGSLPGKIRQWDLIVRFAFMGVRAFFRSGGRASRAVSVYFIPVGKKLRLVNSFFLSIIHAGFGRAENRFWRELEEENLNSKLIGKLAGRETIIKTVRVLGVSIQTLLRLDK